MNDGTSAEDVSGETSLGEDLPEIIATEVNLSAGMQSMRVPGTMVGAKK